MKKNPVHTKTFIPCHTLVAMSIKAKLPAGSKNVWLSKLIR